MIGGRSSGLRKILQQNKAVAAATAGRSQLNSSDAHYRCLARPTELDATGAGAAAGVGLGATIRSGVGRRIRRFCRSFGGGWRHGCRRSRSRRWRRGRRRSCRCPGAALATGVAVVAGARRLAAVDSGRCYLRPNFRRRGILFDGIQEHLRVLWSGQPRPSAASRRSNPCRRRPVCRPGPAG